MSNYPGRRKGTRRIVLWRKNRRHEWIVRGTKADGDAFEARKRLDLSAAEHETRVAPRFSRICTEKYRVFAEANLTRETWRARSNILATLCLFFGEKRMDSFVEADVERYKAQRRADSKLAPISLNTELQTFRHVFRWAKEQGYPVVLPKIRFAKVPRGRPRIWTREQVSKLLEETAKRDRELLRMVLFLLNTGCRKGEAIAAEWSWVDLERGMLSIPATAAWRPKSGRAREVTISDACRTVLLGPRNSRWLFSKGNGSKYDRFPDAMFKEVQTAAGVSGGPHTCRHVFASLFLQKTPDVFLLAKVLGHTSQHTTMMYAHLLPEHLEKSRNAVNIAAPIRTVAKAVAKRARRGEKQAFWPKETARR